MDWIRAVELNHWADSLESRGCLPKLVRFLIHATSDSVTRIEIPADEEVQRQGVDGLVETKTATAFIPEATSIWEMGTGADPSSKANGDFSKRSKQGDDANRRETTFVFVTPRDWTDKGGWTEEKKKLGIWKDVRVLDSSSLAEWIEMAPSVAIWLAKRLDKRPAGVTDIESHWLNVSAIAEQSLKPKVFLTSRGEAVEKCLSWIKSEPSAIALESSSPFDVIDFIAAVLVNEQADFEVERALARSVIVEEIDAWRTLAISQRPLLLIQHPRLTLEPEEIAEALRHRHHVLLCSHRFASGLEGTLELPRVFRDELQKALEECGFSNDLASRVARESGGSLSALKRRLAKVGSNSFPRWCDPKAAAELVPLLLAGAWDDSSPADQAIAAEIAGRPYADVVAIAQAWSIDVDPPIGKAGNRWNLVSREDAWRLIGKSITANQIQTFVDAAVKVLGCDDPKFELPPDQRWMAAIHGKSLVHTPTLRESLIETIALLGARSGELTDAEAPRAAAAAARIVREVIPVDATWERWATLSHYLPKLAEAAPEVVLKIIEDDLDSPKSQLPKLLPDSGDPMFSPCYHAGVLWALECLAWAPGLISRVSLVLARLAERDPGGRWNNRPDNTLRELFLPWHPQVGVSVAQRLRIIDLLLKRHNEVAWKLMIELLPGAHSIASPTYRPYWRDWALDSPPKVTNKDYWDQVDGIAERLVRHCESNPERLQALVERITSLNRASLQAFFDKLTTFANHGLSDDNRQSMWMALQEVLRRHRRHKDADWALPSEVCDELAGICEKFAPSDALSELKPLFTQWPELFDDEEHLKYDEREKRLRDMRLIGIRRLFEEGDLGLIVQLAEVVENAWILGYLLAESALVTDETEILPELLDAENPKHMDFAFGFAWRKFQLGGWNWIDSITIAEWRPLELGILGRACPFGPTTWNRVDTWGADAKLCYWSQVDPRGDELTQTDVVRAAAELKAANRPWSVIFLLNMELHAKKPVDWIVISDALETVLMSNSEEVQSGWKGNGPRWEVRKLIEHLQGDATADESRVAAIEWVALPLLDTHHGGTPKTLHRLLHENPKMFAELMGMMFFPKHLPVEERQQPSDSDSNRGRLAHGLLDNWHTLPGTRADGTVDGDLLREWVIHAREECRAIDRLEIGDSHLGQLFAYAPDDEDGTWPCLAVREIVELIGSEQLLSGLSCGVKNKRGVTSRSPKDGGDQERILASQFIRHAEAIEIEWPKTASVLRSIASSYESEARMHDEDIRDW